MDSERSMSGRPYCEHTGKVCYTSTTDARKAMTGAIKSKHMRIYRCTDDKSHYHITKNRLDKVTSRKRAAKRQRIIH